MQFTLRTRWRRDGEGDSEKIYTIEFHSEEGRAEALALLVDEDDEIVAEDEDGVAAALLARAAEPPAWMGLLRRGMELLGMGAFYAGHFAASQQSHTSGAEWVEAVNEWRNDADEALRGD